MAATLQTLREGGSQHPEEIVNFFDAALTLVSGVIDPTAGHLEVEEQAVPDMSVQVGLGKALIVTSDKSMCYPVRLSGDPASVTIDPNSSGNSRIDAIVLYINLSASANTDSSNVATLTKVNGTPAGSPTAPSDADIATAIGASNPFVRLANVTVASGATSIANANISDQRRRACVKSPSPLRSMTFAASFTPDFFNGNQQSIILTDNITINTPTNMNVGDWLYLELIQDGGGGNTLTWSVTGSKNLSADMSINSTGNKRTTYALQKTAGGFNIYLVGKEYT